MPPKPNVLFKDYTIRCSKDMIIKDISAKTLSPIPFEKAKARQEDIKIILLKHILIIIQFITGNLKILCMFMNLFPTIRKSYH